MLIRVAIVLAFALLIGANLGTENGLAQTVTGPSIGAGAEAASAAMGTPPRALDRLPYAALPAGGGSVSDSALQVVVASLGILDIPAVSVSGTSANGGSATSTVTISRVNLFGGRVRASNVLVIARVSVTGGVANAEGVVIIDELIVDNLPVTITELGQAVLLPGIGTLIARDVQINQTGGNTTYATVRALRIVPENGAGVLEGRELLIGATSAGIPGVLLAPPHVTASGPLATFEAGLGLGTRLPLERSIALNDNDGDDDSNDNDEDDNFEIDNDNVAQSRATATSARGTVTPGVTGTVGAVPPGSTGTITPVAITVTATQTSTPQPSRAPTLSSSP